MKEWIGCVGKRRGRRCYFRGKIEFNGKWWCRVCYRMCVIEQDLEDVYDSPDEDEETEPAPEPEPKRPVPTFDLIPEDDLIDVYVRLKRYEKYGSHMKVSAEVMRRTLIRALEENAHLRGIDLPVDEDDQDEVD